MFSFLYFVKKLYFVALLLVCVFFVTAHVNAVDPTSPDKIELFKVGGTGDIIIPENGDANSKNEIDIKSFYSPFLIAADNVIVAIVGANRSGGSKNNIDILTNYTVIKDDGVKEDFTIDKIKTNWNTQFAFQKVGKKDDPVKSLAAAAKKNTIYILMVNDSENSGEEEESEEKNWDCVIVKGSIEQQTPLKITWTATEKLDLLKGTDFQGQKLKDYPQFISSFVTSDETVVFVVKGKIERDKDVFAIILFKDAAQKPEVVNVDDGCDANFFLWKDKVIIISANCGENANQKIQEFDVTKKQLENSNKSVELMWEFLKDKKDITTTNINKTPVVLFTHKGTGDQENNIYLWVTDGNRSYKVGSIVNDDSEITVASLLYTKKQLFCLQQQTGGKSIILKHLDTQQK